MEQLTLDPTDALLRRIARDALVIAQLEALADHLQGKLTAATKDDDGSELPSS